MAKKIAYLDCHVGISGAMFLGAFLDSGLPFEQLRDGLALVPIQGYQLELEKIHEKGIQGSRFRAALTDQEFPVRSFSDIRALLQQSRLPLSVREMAQAVFLRLAEAEAAVRGITSADVHFHEVGAVDALIDIVGAAIGIDVLGITQLYASSLPLTSGHVQTTQGFLPVPAPVTLELLRHTGAVWRPRDVEAELVTPTGAAILATLARFELPVMTIERVGYGFGQKHLPWPDCLRLCLGHTQHSNGGDADTDWVAVIETHVDTMSGELLGGLMERLLAAGALDVSYTAIQMKKNRPATLITVIAQAEEGEQLAMVLLGETNTLGVRIQQVQRLKAQREQQRIETPLGPLVIKVKRLGGRVLSASPEYEECQRIARTHNLPLAQVYEVAHRAIQAAIIQEQREKQ